MAYNLKDKLVVAISSRALFNLEEENRIFENEGLDAYYEHQLKNESKLLKKGVGYRIVENLLKINKHFDDEKRQVEVIILSKNNASISLRITNSIDKYNLDILRSGWTSGADISSYLKAFKVDLFLSADDCDVTSAIKNRVAAAKILHTNNDILSTHSDQLRIAFDGDAVLFSGESENIYQEGGLEAFTAHEIKKRDDPLKKGPFARFLMLLSNIQSKFPEKISPIRTALVTARSAPTHERVIKTLSVWNVKIDEAFFLGGSEKYEVLEAFGADIFFDDQDVHLDLSSRVVPSAKVVHK